MTHILVVSHSHHMGLTRRFTVKPKSTKQYIRYILETFYVQFIVSEEDAGVRHVLQLGALHVFVHWPMPPLTFR